MVICKYCSVEQRNGHENGQSTPPSSKLHICYFCNKRFMTAEEIDEHTCEGNLGIMYSWLEKIKKSFVDMMKKRAKPKSLGQCHFCLQELYTVDEVVEHRETCEAIKTGNLLEEVYKLYKEMVGEPVDEAVTITPMASSSPKSSTSDDNEQSKSSNKRVLQLDTSTEKDNATESSPETSSPPSKIRRTSNKDIIEIGQESATDSTIYDAKTKTCAKTTFDCVFCVLKFQSSDALRTHVTQYHNKDEK